MKVLDFHGMQTSKVNKDRRSCFSCTGHASFTHGTCPLTKMYIPQSIAVVFNKNVQREITGNTTQYYQNTTKGFEFTDANFKIKAQSKIAKGNK